MFCTSCNSKTRVLKTTRRHDGAVIRRRECVECGRRFTTSEAPEHSDWLGELPEVHHGPDGGGPLEGVRRKAILAAARDENDRALAATVEELAEIHARLAEILAAAEAREAEEAIRGEDARMTFVGSSHTRSGGDGAPPRRASKKGAR